MGLFGNLFKDRGKVVERGDDGSYTRKYKDGTTEKVRFTKTREVHDFDGPGGKGRVWSKRRD